MFRSRRARSRRAALEAARRSSSGGGWRSSAPGGAGGGAARAAAARTAIAIALLGIGFGVGFGVGRWSGRPRTSSSLEVGAPARTSVGAPAAAAAELPAAAAAPVVALDDVSAPAFPVASEPPPAAAQAAPVAIVIDDLGRSLEVIDVLRGFGVPLTYAVLPFETRTAAVAARLTALGEEVLCHLPMEAQRGENPGPGALTEGMDETAIRDATARALEAVPGAVGVNNHMGSALSEDPTAMAAVLDVVRAHGLFFLDSRTSAASVAYGLARDAGMPAAERKVFLDGDRALEAIRHQVRRLLALANRGEPAIAIGHPYPETLAVLGEEIPRARAKGYRFTTVSELMVGR